MNYFETERRVKEIIEPLCTRLGILFFIFVFFLTFYVLRDRDSFEDDSILSMPPGVPSQDAYVQMIGSSKYKDMKKICRSFL